jgi:ABC-type xylose transport system permease subunit
VARVEEPPIPPDDVVDDGEPTADAAVVASPELVANTLGEYLRASIQRVRGGDAGVLPVILGLFLISAIFQSLNSNFLTAGNLVNLLVQGAVFMLLAMGEVFVLLLGEIDLSAGFVAGLGGTIAAELVKETTGWPWWAAILVALLCCAAIGAFQGTIITRIGLPSFVVTLAGLLAWQGVMLLILGTGEGLVPINNNIINDFANGILTPAAGWIVMILIVAAFGAMTWFRDARRRKSGLVAPPVSLTVIKIAAAAAAGVAVVLICNTDRGTAFRAIRGVPWVVLIVLGVLAMWTFVLGRTKFGRYLYAIGGNAEAARRAGINLSLVRTAAFALSSFTAGIAGLIYASRLRSISTNIDGGTLVLYAVAAAVIGGTSLFGGRGRARDAVVGGVVVAAINNGMGLQGYSTAARLVVTAVVLVVAVTIDAVARRGRSTRV